MERMKNVVLALILTAVIGLSAVAQTKIDEQRMERDIAVAENVLSTLMKQQFSKSNFFPMEVQGTYMPGFGVTFRLPEDFANQMMFMDAVNVSGYPRAYGGINQIVVTGEPDDAIDSDNCEDCPASTRTLNNSRRNVRTATIAPIAKKKSNDSLRNTYSQAMLQAAKDFIADYGDMISQLGPDERIVVTNKSEGGRNQWLYRTDVNSPRKYMSMEATKSDLTLFKQGKLSRDQFFAKLRIVNAETADDLSPDLELLGSIFNRLYRADLSKTYFLQEEVYYERLKNYGVIYNMHAYSSTVVAEDYLSNGKVRTLYEMPTLQLSGIDKDERLKRVKELYPAFEKNLIDDVLEYSKTIKSLADNEVVVFNVKMTECKGCNIPTSLEITIKQNVLRDYSAGKITKEAALAKATIKKGPNQ